MDNRKVENIKPEDMPKFLNNLAADYFEEDADIKFKLFACAFTLQMFLGLKK